MNQLLVVALWVNLDGSLCHGCRWVHTVIGGYGWLYVVIGI